MCARWGDIWERQNFNAHMLVRFLTLHAGEASVRFPQRAVAAGLFTIEPQGPLLRITWALDSHEDIKTPALTFLTPDGILHFGSKSVVQVAQGRDPQRLPWYMFETPHELLLQGQAALKKELRRRLAWYASSAGDMLRLGTTVRVTGGERESLLGTVGSAAPQREGEGDKDFIRNDTHMTGVNTSMTGVASQTLGAAAPSQFADTGCVPGAEKERGGLESREGRGWTGGVDEGKLPGEGGGKGAGEGGRCIGLGEGTGGGGGGEEFQGQGALTGKERGARCGGAEGVGGAVTVQLKQGRVKPMKPNRLFRPEIDHWGAMPFDVDK
jgi:hypothetical protein